MAMTIKREVALELRLHPTPSATDDTDLVIHGAEDLIQALDQSLAEENGEPRVNGGFTSSERANQGTC